MLNFPPHILDSVKIVGTIQNAWFTAAYFAGACAVWSGLAEERTNVRLIAATVSPLGISYTIANRLELSYPVIAAFSWLFYKPSSMITSYICFTAFLLRLLCSKQFWGNFLALIMYCLVASLHCYASVEATNYAGALGAFTMAIMAWSCHCDHSKTILYYHDMYGTLCGMGLAVICFGLSYLHMSVL